ncbi:MAG: FAD-dependent thymidylate synthase [Chloroflexota bacterium]
MHSNPQALVGKRVAVLDQGEILCTGILGDDHTIVESARVSFLGESKGDKQDKKLLKYLLFHQHTSPFEMVVFRFRVVAPVIVWWQWVRHRMASYNAQSGRYTPFTENSFYVPAAWRQQAQSNKQASDGALSPALSEEFTQRLIARYAEGYADYEQALAAGIAREQARLFLHGWGLYYTWIVEMNALALMHFIELRAESDAQWEIQQYAIALRDEFFKPALPWTAEFFEVANTKRHEVAEMLQKM